MKAINRNNKARLPGASDAALRLSKAMARVNESMPTASVALRRLNALACLLGRHEYSYRFDAGRDSPIHQTEFGILFYSDDKVICSRCGHIGDAEWNKHKHLPEIISKTLA